MAVGSPEGINFNSHGWSEGPWSEEKPVVNGTTDSNPYRVEFPPLLMFNPLRVGLSIGHSHGFRLERHPWLFTLIPFGDAVKL